MVEIIVEEKAPTFYSIPQQIRIPTSFIDLSPLVDVGIRRIITGDNKKISRTLDGSITVAVDNPLSPSAFKLLLLLFGKKRVFSEEKEKLEYTMKAKDIAEIIMGNTKSAYLHKVLSQLSQANLSIGFDKESLIPKEFKRKVFKREGVNPLVLKDLRIIRGRIYYIHKKKQVVTLPLEDIVMDFYSSICPDYVYVDTNILKKLSNKHPVELLTYLLALKFPKNKVKVHKEEFLLLYYLGCSKSFLKKSTLGSTKVETIRKKIQRTDRLIEKSLQKLKDFGVLEDYSILRERLRIGDSSRTAPFPVRLELKAPRKNTVTEVCTHEEK